MLCVDVYVMYDILFGYIWYLQGRPWGKPVALDVRPCGVAMVVLGKDHVGEPMAVLGKHHVG